MEFYGTDWESLFSRIEEGEEELKCKRRWLMGIHETSKSKRRRLKVSKFIKNWSLSESLLREDDVFYETVKNFVEKGFGACSAETEHHAVQDNEQQFDLFSIGRVLSNLLDNMTNNGLYLLAKILTGGLLKFDKTRRKMKRVIKEHLRKVLRNQSTNSHQISVSKQIYQLLKDPHNFQENCPIPLRITFQSHHPAVTKVLGRLESMPSQALMAMHRRLRGIPGMLQLKPHRSGWSRKGLIKQVRKTSLKMLSDLGNGDELQEPLAKAMAIGDLSLNLEFGHQNASATEFLQFSPEIEELQKDIRNAIWLIENKIRFPMLKNLQLLLDPSAEISNGSLRFAIKKLLTEYLFECSDMDTIPKSLLDAIAIINRSSQGTPPRFLSKEEKEEEIECVLGVSAQMKQIMWDLLPEQEFDEDYADAYVEDLEESDDGGDDEQMGLPKSCRFDCNNSNSLAESIGHTQLVDYKLPTSAVDENVYSSPCWESKFLNSQINQDGTQYLAESIGHAQLVDYKSPTSVVNENVCSSPCWESKFLNSPINQDGTQYHRSMVKVEPVDSISFASMPKGNGAGTYAEGQESKVDSANPLDFSPLDFSSEEAKFMQARFMHNMQCEKRNRFLAVQEICDETSMVAYNFIGHLLYEFAQMDGLDLDRIDELYLKGDKSIPEDSQDAKTKQTSSEDNMHGSAVVQVVEELMPSLPKSKIEKVKELMGLQ